MPWYDTNLNPIEPPPNDNKAYIFIQKPHTRTLKFSVGYRRREYTNYRNINRIHKLPWLVFLYHKDKLFVGLSKEMPTLDSQLCPTLLPNVYFHTFQICTDNIYFHYGDDITPQDYVDYFWQSMFECSETAFINCENITYKKYPTVDLNLRKLISFL